MADDQYRYSCIDFIPRLDTIHKLDPADGDTTSSLEGSAGVKVDCVNIANNTGVFTRLCPGLVGM